MHLPASVVPIRRALALPLLALALTAAACSGGSGSPAIASPGSGSGAGGPAVTIQDFQYAPASLAVAVGDTVTWTNLDTAGHTVTAVDGSFDSKTLAKDATFSQTFTRAGTYSYVCTIHASMKGTIVVK